MSGLGRGADIEAPLPDVRFTPESGHRWARSPCHKADMDIVGRDHHVRFVLSALRQKRILAAAHKSSFLPMRIATISAPIRLANVGDYSLGVVMFDPERSN